MPKRLNSSVIDASLVKRKAQGFDDASSSVQVVNRSPILPPSLANTPSSMDDPLFDQERSELSPTHSLQRLHLDDLSFLPKEWQSKEVGMECVA